MDDHDLTVSRDGVVVAQSAVLPSHTEATVSFDATPGTYRVYCSLLGGAHDAAGMHATLTVG
jgi:plastocyanin